MHELPKPTNPEQANMAPLPSTETFKEISLLAKAALANAALVKPSSIDKELLNVNPMNPTLKENSFTYVSDHPIYPKFMPDYSIHNDLKTPFKLYDPNDDFMGPHLPEGLFKPLSLPPPITFDKLLTDLPPIELSSLIYNPESDSAFGQLPSNDEVIIDLSPTPAEEKSLATKKSAFTAFKEAGQGLAAEVKAQAHGGEASVGSAEITKPKVVQPKVEIKLSKEEAKEIAEAFEKNKYVKEAPKFSEQVKDETRTNTFKYVDSSLTYGTGSDIEQANVKELTEHEGLEALNRFLQRVVEGDGYNPDYIDDTNRETAASMLEGLTFIGEKEYDEAARGIAAHWKAFLAEDPTNRIYVHLGISKGSGVRKSDLHLFENILLTFSDQELEGLAERISIDPETIQGDPERLRIILLDDWIISGSQMGGSYSDLCELPNYKKEYDKSIRINLITASVKHLEQGLNVSPSFSSTPKYVPVEAYFKAHQPSKSNNGMHITGTHSSVDFDFQNSIYNMTGYVKTVEDQPANMPPMTNIVRLYRNAEPAVIVEENGRIRKNQRAKV